MLAAALAGLAVLLVFSIVDYPLRMSALAVVAAILPACAVRQDRRPDRGKPPAWAGPATVMSALAVALLVAANGLSSALVERQMPHPAVAIAPWSSQGWSQRASEAQVEGDAPASRDAGLRALAIAPMDVAALRAVAAAELAQGNIAQGYRLFQSAAGLGWRDRFTQLWLVDQAMASGNLQLAAERIDALLRQDVLGAPLLARLRMILSMPGGEQAIADRLGQNPPWTQGFFNALADDLATAPRLPGLMKAMRASGVRVDPGMTALIRWRLADAGRFDMARILWQASGGAGLIGDGGFEQTQAPPPAGAAPFAWRAPSLPGVRAVVAEPGARNSRRALTLTSDGYAAGTALAQTIALPQGRYRLEAWMRGDGSVPGTGPGIAIGCGTQGTNPVLASIKPVLQGTQWRRVSLPFQIASGCTGQTLSILLPQTSGQPLAVSIDEVTVIPIHDGT
jgi:hypothetical protein